MPHYPQVIIQTSCKASLFNKAAVQVKHLVENHPSKSFKYRQAKQNVQRNELPELLMAPNNLEHLPELILKELESQSTLYP